MEQYLNVSELASLLKVKRGTVYSWISRGVPIPCVKVGGTVRFRSEAIEEWLLKMESERKRRRFEL